MNLYGQMNQLTTLDNLSKIYSMTGCDDFSVHCRVVDGQGEFIFKFYWNLGRKAGGIYSWRRTFTDLELIHLSAPADSIVDLIIQSAKVVIEKKKEELRTDYKGGASAYNEAKK